MIKINLSPLRSDDAPLQAEWATPILTVNGTAYDLSELPDGASATHPVLGRISREGDDYECTLRLPHGPQQPFTFTDEEVGEIVTQWAGEDIRFPAPIEMTTDGVVDVPVMSETREPIPTEPTEEGNNGTA